MYLKSFTIENVKCYGDPITLNFEEKTGEKETIRKWNVILGENGTGKSTLLQAIAMTLMGDDVANRLRTPKGWVRSGKDVGHISAEIMAGTKDQLTGYGARLKTSHRASLAITGDQEVQVNGVVYNGPAIVFEGDKQRLNSLKRGPWSPKSGWLSAGYGPFRRLSGGSPDALRSIFQGKKDARFLTLFREDAALEDLQDWLKDLDYKSRQDDSGSERAQHLKDAVKKTIDHLLPEGVSLSKISAEGVFFMTPYGENIPINELSDGYRSVLALAGDLIHRMDDTYENLEDWIDPDGIIITEGVVLIDELDAHLHPVWQRKIGFWLQEKFPNLQFIVATHSPFIAQAAAPNGIFVLRQKNEQGPTRQVGVFQDEVSVRGWRAEQILAVLFDLSGTRSLEAEEYIRKHAELEEKKQAGRLTLAEEKNLSEMSEWLRIHLSPPGDTPQEIKKYRGIQSKLDEFLSNGQDSRP